MRSATFSERFPVVIFYQMINSIHHFCPSAPPSSSLQLKGASNGDDLHFGVDHLNQIHLLNEIDDLVQTGIDALATIAYRTDTNLGPLPKIIIAALGDRHIEPGFYPIDQLPDHMALSLQGMILWNP